jgi:Raf kinase inhibitor-like YbhB/YbcL family protein
MTVQGAFRQDKVIPNRFTAAGKNVSPPLRWRDPPRGTRSLAILCEDPDAASGSFVHWLAWGIPGDRREVGEGASGGGRAELHEGRNDFGGLGYRGPRPPPGRPHRYRFHVYALDDQLVLQDGAGRTAFEAAIQGHVLAEGVLTGRFGIGPH